VRKESNANSKFTPHLLGRSAGFTCESCLKKVGMVIRQYGTGRWLCYDCHFKREIPKGTRETLIRSDTKNV